MPCAHDTDTHVVRAAALPESAAHGTLDADGVGAAGVVASADVGPAPPRTGQPPCRPALDVAAIVKRLPLVVWDVEANGLSEPLICQLAYVHVDAQGSVSCYNEVWPLPHGARMSAAATKVHGLTEERVSRSGIRPPEALREFAHLLDDVLREGGTVVGHNVSFDCRAFRDTAKHWHVPCVLDKGRMFDTYRESVRFSPLLNAAGRRKAFKNDELCARSAHRISQPPGCAGAQRAYI